MTSSNSAASVRARLRNYSRDQNLEFGTVLTRFALERMLYRISISEQKESFLLKGALLFDLWADIPSRPTRDIDLLGFGSEDAEILRTVFARICALRVPDGILFDPDSVHVSQIRKVANYPGYRLRIDGQLDGAELPVQIDIGFGDVVTPTPIEIKFPVLLLDLPEPQLRAYPKATVIAEKFEAIISLGFVNSRLKDYFDLWVLLEQGEVLDFEVSRALANTCKRRGTVIPDSIPPGLSGGSSADPRVIAQWQAFCSRNGLLTPALAEIVSQLDLRAMPIFKRARMITRELG